MVCWYIPFHPYIKPITTDKFYTYLYIDNSMAADVVAGNPVFEREQHVSDSKCGHTGGGLGVTRSGDVVVLVAFHPLLESLGSPANEQVYEEDEHQNEAENGDDDDRVHMGAFIGRPIGFSTVCGPRFICDDGTSTGVI
jgi:hypothetical protein